MPEQITINLQTVLAWCLFVAALGGALAWLKKGAAPLFTPYKTLKYNIDHHAECLQRDKVRLDKFDTRLDNNDAALKEITEDNKIIMESLLLLLEHAETGNGTGEIKTGKEKLQGYLINR